MGGLLKYMLPTRPVELELVPWEQRAMAVFVVLYLQAVWIKNVVARLPPGPARLLASLPVLAANLYIPLMFHQTREVICRFVASFILMWLSSFKLLALIINRGPLDETRTVAGTFLLYTMPVYPKPLGGSAAKDGWLRLLLLWLFNLAFLLAMAYLMTVQLPQFLHEYIFTAAFYGLITSLMDGPASLITGVMNIVLLDSFDLPWISQSVSEFWAKRWNICTGHLLRSLIYDPLVEGRLYGQTPAELAATKAATADGKPVRPPRSHAMHLLGGFLTFLVSGLAHELILFYLSPGYRFGWWCAFFTVQSPVITLEGLGRKWMRKRGIKVPAPLCMVYATSVIMMSAHVFWFPPIEQHYPVLRSVVQSILSMVS